MPIAETIRYLRQRAGMSQEALAERSGVSKSYISQIESGRQSPASITIATISALASALGGQGASWYCRCGLWLILNLASLCLLFMHRWVAQWTQRRYLHLGSCWSASRKSHPVAVFWYAWHQRMDLLLAYIPLKGSKISFQGSGKSRGVLSASIVFICNCFLDHSIKEWHEWFWTYFSLIWTSYMEFPKIPLHEKYWEF